MSFRSLLALGAAGVLLLLALGGIETYRDLQALREREAELERRLEASRERIRKLERRLELLRDDPATLERLAREQLGMARPGEVVILTRPRDPATEPATTPERP